MRRWAVAGAAILGTTSIVLACGETLTPNADLTPKDAAVVPNDTATFIPNLDAAGAFDRSAPVCSTIDASYCNADELPASAQPGQLNFPVEVSTKLERSITIKFDLFIESLDLQPVANVLSIQLIRLELRNAMAPLPTIVQFGVDQGDRNPPSFNVRAEESVEGFATSGDFVLPIAKWIRCQLSVRNRDGDPALVLVESTCDDTTFGTVSFGNTFAQMTTMLGAGSSGNSSIVVRYDNVVIE